ncbi:helicase-associated domain-containing protein [Microbacterium sp. Au-Mic1]|uniref:helicase-associated domain-containing protein n=1 Tax=Microbacterium sp. Au-Mic1 TaxID=2906457 RepID=UPI001E33F0BE|nr:helicase-associated domain-containing protein [Microbacterium sp. Au-Mic1]MCE4026601.1 helicase-associated domain-containing protein [Microbacterium sp. Au-Mic1]
MSTHARLLAEALSARTDDELAALFGRREVRPDAGWHDFFDAAEGLLDPSSVTRVLPRLTRAEATGLVAAASGSDPGAVSETLRALALLPPSGTTLPPTVAAAVAGRDAAADPLLTATDSASGVLAASADEPSSARAAERAFTTVATLADALLLAEEGPLALLAGGTVGLSEKRRMSERGLPDDPGLLDDLLALGTAAGLLRPIERTLHLSDAGAEWLRLPGSERWSRLVAGFREALPPVLRSEDGGWIPLSDWPGEHPWDPSWPGRTDALVRQARLIGLVADAGQDGAAAESPWAEAPRRGADPDPSALAAYVPAEVDRIFLQNDLTAIAPGPLLPALDLRLRGMAARESASQASSYRFTADSLSTALSAGETEEGVLTFLEGISLTGVPQPLRYLLAQSASRHGQVQVGIDPATGRTRVRSRDAHLLQAIGVDQALRPLGLVPEDTAEDTTVLTTRVNRDTVFWALTDEHYPAALVDAAGAVERPVRTTAESAPPPPPDAQRYAALIARLREAREGNADAAWLERELEHAAKQRAVLAVEVAMPDGTARELVLEVTGFGGGRVRGRDRASDVERTLPIRSILSTRAIEDAES